jgi:hypothetical protein
MGVVPGRSTQSLACMTRGAGKSVAIGCFAFATAVAFYYEFAHCEKRLWAASVIAITLIAPGLLFFVLSRNVGAAVACVPMVITAIWAYRVECVLPYTGGGAAMAFVVVFLYGAPAALILGGIAEHVIGKRHAG